MLLNRRLFLLLACCLTIFSLSQIAAQDETPTLTPFPTEVIIPTETATDVPSATPLPTETATEIPSPTLLPSETPTALPSETPTASETVTETATMEMSESPSPTLTVDASLSPSPSSTITLTPSATESAVATSVFPTAQPLTQLFSDTFDTGDVSRWTLGPGWGLVASEGGQALQTTTDAPLMLTEQVGEGAAEARVQFSTGSVQLTLRQGATGSYAVQLGADGQVKLLVTGQVVTSTTVAANQAGQWRILRLTAANGYLRVAVDGVEVLAALDAAPLPDGILTVAGSSAGILLVDDVGVFTPSTTPTVFPTATNTATDPILPTLYSESFENPQFGQWFTDITRFIVSVADGHALHVMNRNSYLSLNQGNVLDVVFQADISLSSGIASFGVRHSGAGYYRVALNANGTITLYRSEQALATTVTTPFVAGQWREVKLSVIGNTLRVMLDNVEVLNFTDTSPLPSGTMFVAGNVETLNDFLVDNLVIQGNIAPLETQPLINTQNQRQSSIQMLNSFPAGSSQRIIFSKNVNTTGLAHYQLFSVDDCGGDQIQLTFDSGNHSWPDLNLNGQIVFVDDLGGNYDLYKMDYDGSNLQRLTNSPYTETAPSLSPDGSKVVFNRIIQNVAEIYTLDLDDLGFGTWLPVPDSHSKWYPKWSPIDNRILFYVDYHTTTGSISNVFVMNSEGTSLSALTSDNVSVEPSWSPDGTEIVVYRYLGQTGWVDVIDSSTPDETLRHIIPETTHNILMPQWSPDGSTILYSSYDPENPNSPYLLLHTVSSLGDGLNRLTGQTASSEGCNFGILPVEQVAGFDVDYGLVIGAQVTPAPSTTPATVIKPQTPIEEECNPDGNPYFAWIKRRHDKKIDKSIMDALELTGITYQSHHGLPDAFLANLTEVISKGNLGFDFGYLKNNAPTIQIPFANHYPITTLWNNKLDRYSKWREQLTWGDLMGSDPLNGDFVSNSIMKDMMRQGKISENCRKLYKKALIEYLKYLICEILRNEDARSALIAVMQAPPSSSPDVAFGVQVLKDMLNWLGGIDSLLPDCSTIVPTEWFNS